MISAFFVICSVVPYSLSLLPKKFTLENYREVLSGSDFPRWFLNSFLVAGITTLSVLVFDPLLGYAFCKYRFRGKEAIFTMLPVSYTHLDVYKRQALANC